MKRKILLFSATALLALVFAAQANASIAIDSSTPAVKDTNGTSSTSVTSNSFTPAANSLIVVLFGQTNGGGSNFTITDSLGSHLTYTLLASRSTNGINRIYVADAPSSPSSMTVTVSWTTSRQWNQILPVVVTGAKTAANQNGGTANTGSSSGTPSATISSLVGSNSLILGSLTNNTNVTAPTAGTGQSRTINGHDTWAGNPDADWDQYLTGMNLSAGSSATINDTAPTGIQYSEAIAEILANSGNPPVNTVAPATPSGTAAEGQTLTADNGTWTGDPTITFTYQWQRCPSTCSDIGGATGSTYVPTDSDVGDTIKVKVTGTNSAGNATATSSATSAVTDAAAPVNTVLPAVTDNGAGGGTLSAPKVSDVLSTTNGTWTGDGTITYTYQWRSCDASGANCSNISSATSSTYTVASGDVGNTIRVVVTAEN